MSGWDNVGDSIQRSLQRTVTRAGNNIVTGAAGSVGDGLATRTQMVVDGAVSGLFGVESRTSMSNSGFGRGGIHTTGVDGQSAYKGAVSGRWQTPGEEQVYPGAVPGGPPRVSGYSYTPSVPSSRQNAAQVNAAMQQQVELYEAIGARVIEAQQYARGTPERQAALDEAIAIANRLPREGGREDGPIVEPISGGRSRIITSGLNGQSFRYQINPSDNFASPEELVASMGRVAATQMKPAHPVGREDFGLKPLPGQAPAPAKSPGGDVPLTNGQSSGDDQKLVDGIVAAIAEVQLAKKSDPAVINAVASQVAAAAEKDTKVYDGVKWHKIGPVTVMGKNGVPAEIEGGIYTPARITQLVMAAMGAEPEVVAAVNAKMGGKPAAPAKVEAPAPTKVEAPAAAPAAPATAPAPAQGAPAKLVIPEGDGLAAKAYSGIKPDDMPKGLKQNQVDDVQAALKKAYPNLDLGKTGPNKDGVDNQWGAKSQAALVQAAKDAGIKHYKEIDFSDPNDPEFKKLMTHLEKTAHATKAAPAHAAPAPSAPAPAAAAPPSPTAGPAPAPATEKPLTIGSIENTDGTGPKIAWATNQKLNSPQADQVQELLSKLTTASVPWPAKQAAVDKAKAAGIDLTQLSYSVDGAAPVKVADQAAALQAPVAGGLVAGADPSTAVAVVAAAVTRRDADVAKDRPAVIQTDAPADLPIVSQVAGLGLTPRGIDLAAQRAAAQAAQTQPEQVVQAPATATAAVPSTLTEGQNKVVALVKAYTAMASSQGPNGSTPESIANYAKAVAAVGGPNADLRVTMDEAIQAYSIASGGHRPAFHSFGGRQEIDFASQVTPAFMRNFVEHQRANGSLPVFTPDGNQKIDAAIANATREAQVSAAPVVLAGPAAGGDSVARDRAAILGAFEHLAFAPQPAPAAASMPAPDMQAALQQYTTAALDLSPSRVPDVRTQEQREARMGNALA